jgi:hypothetical protein
MSIVVLQMGTVARDEGKQIRVHGIGARGAHAVRKLLVDFESRFLEELCRSNAESAIGTI